MVNKRQAERVFSILNATFTSLEDGVVRRAISKDVSNRGICLLSDKPIRKGSSVKLSIAFPSATIKVIRVVGKVLWQEVWSKEANDDLKYLLGIEFVELAESSQKKLEASIMSMKNRGDTIDNFEHHVSYRLSSFGQSFPVQMTLLKAPPVKISAVGSLIPEDVFTNDDVIKLGLDVSSRTIQRALGAVERRIAKPDQTNAEMMALVAKSLLEKANVNVSEIDRIICSSDPPDSVAPNTAVSVQRLLGAYCPAFDVQMSCVGWLCGIDLASRCLSTGEKRILVLASCQIGSKSFFYNRMHRAIFGDGAGGILLEISSEASKILSVGLWSDGRYFDKIHIPYSWSKLPESIPSEYRNSFFMSPTQEDFFATMDFYLHPFCERLWREAGIQKDEIDCFLMHQPSIPLFEYSLKALDVPKEKTLNYFPKYGNLVAAELPVYIDEALKTGQLKEGNTLFALTYGAGFTMGGMVIRV